MSERPRPVTATVTKPLSMMPNIGVRHRKYSLSSGSSTESLISVLDHDSYESPLPSDQEEEVKQKINKVQASDENDHFKDNDTPKKSQKNGHDDTISYTESYTATYTDDTTTDNTRTHSTTTPQDKLSPFVKWTLQKRALERQQRQQRKREMNQLMEKEKMENEKKMEHKKKCEIKYNNWVQKKTDKQAELQRKQMEKEKNEKEVEHQKKKEIDEGSQRKFNEWQEKKKAERQEKLNAEKALKKLKEEEKEAQKSKNAKAYEEWYMKAKDRPRTAPLSYGYTHGRLKDYHDTGAYPQPSYENPIPWQPIHIPQPSSYEKRKTTKKKRFNQNKYF